MYRRILIATDGSPLSRKAAEEGVALARSVRTRQTEHRPTRRAGPHPAKGSDGRRADRRRVMGSFARHLRRPTPCNPLIVRERGP